MSATVGEPVEVVEWRYPDMHVRIEFFRCAIEGEPRPLEGQEMAWVAPAELGRYEFPPADAVLARAAQAAVTAARSPRRLQAPQPSTAA